MKKIFILIFTLFIVHTLSAQVASDSIKPLTIGEVRTIRSAVLNEERRLNIYLPDKYDKTKSYPVLYLLDGSANEDFLHIVGLVQFFNMTFNMPETIVVGIANVDRKRDFTYHTDLKDLQKKYPTTGHSAAFIQFIETELQPFIQTNYATSDTKYLLGQSLGGLLATEILIKKPALFSHYLIVSPSLWWDNESLLKQLQKDGAPKTSTAIKVYIAAGKKEDKLMQNDAKALYDVLTQTGGKKIQSDYSLMAEEDHATILHRSIYEMFLKIFPYKP